MFMPEDRYKRTRWNNTYTQEDRRLEVVSEKLWQNFSSEESHILNAIAIFSDKFSRTVYDKTAHGWGSKRIKNAEGQLESNWVSIDKSPSYVKTLRSVGLETIHAVAIKEKPYFASMTIDQTEILNWLESEPVRNVCAKLDKLKEKLTEQEFSELSSAGLRGGGNGAILVSETSREKVAESVRDATEFSDRISLYNEQGQSAFGRLR
jgi:hypothetical protein